ncbi:MULTISPECIES: hypothetical protein [unclassified Streptomyces]|uniref:hypothetical protein n=1 Tax=unclassified Streptomyces TaxID=2593676 RepID=UPI002966E0CA|nr:hypothetical protein [Streptomyces sp. SJL17-1]
MRDALAARGLVIGHHPPGTALDQLATLISKTAMNVDEIQQMLLGSADSAIRQLQSVTSGRDRVRHTSTCGVLQSLGAEIDALVARRGDGIQTLRMLTTSYADLRGAPKPPPTPAPSRLPAPRRSGR